MILRIILMHKSFINSLDSLLKFFKIKNYYVNY
jgi:hypothetical protein